MAIEADGVLVLARVSAISASIRASSCGVIGWARADGVASSAASAKADLSMAED
jgi:hypothetical protein